MQITMIGVFAFLVKLTNQDYPYFKMPKKVLEIDDSEIVSLIRQNEITCFIHWQEDWDDLTDKQIIEKINQNDGFSYSISSRKSGSGYQSEDKSKYIRIIRQRYSWFKERII